MVEAADYHGRMCPLSSLSSNERWTTLKGQRHEMDIIFKGLNNLFSTFCVCAVGFKGLSRAFHYPVLKPSSKFSSLLLVDVL
jgi:hypothetical protein